MRGLYTFRLTGDTDIAIIVISVCSIGRDSEIAPTNTHFCRRELRFPTIDDTQY